MGGIERPGAREGTSANEGAAPVGRRDFGLAEEIARVERAARDWGVHVDALEGQFVRALLKAIEETGRTNLAALGDLEALLERARRAGEAERRRIEWMIEPAERARDGAPGDGESWSCEHSGGGGDRGGDRANCKGDVSSRGWRREPK